MGKPKDSLKLWHEDSCQSDETYVLLECINKMQKISRQL